MASSIIGTLIPRELGSRNRGIHFLLCTNPPLLQRRRRLGGMGVEHRCHFSISPRQPIGPQGCPLPSSDLGLGNSLPLIHFWVLGHLGSSSYCDCKHQFPSLAPKGQKASYSAFYLPSPAWGLMAMSVNTWFLKIISKFQSLVGFYHWSLYTYLCFSLSRRDANLPLFTYTNPTVQGQLTWHLFQEASSALQSKGVSLCSRRSHSGLCVDGGSEKQVGDRCYLWQR